MIPAALIGIFAWLYFEIMPPSCPRFCAGSSNAAGLSSRMLPSALCRSLAEAPAWTTTGLGTPIALAAAS